MNRDLVLRREHPGDLEPIRALHDLTLSELAVGLKAKTFSSRDIVDVGEHRRRACGDAALRPLEGDAQGFFSKSVRRVTRPVT